MGTACAPNFCPPVEEGVCFQFEDEKGDVVELEFLGLILKEEARFGFFAPCDEEEDEEAYLVVLEVTDLDDEGQPAGFELVDDESLLQDLLADFMEATAGMYRFE